MDSVQGIGGMRGQDRLTPDQKAQVERLAKTDRDVRAHEAAHLAAAGGLARGGAEFTYQMGPDGKMYAVGGKVRVDTSPGRTPEETLVKARQLAAAADAPADPSGQDQYVAAQAGRLERTASEQIAKRSEQNLKSPAEHRPVRALDAYA